MTGAAYGAIYSGVTGGDIGEGAARGAMGWAAGEAANMLIGHTVGYIRSGKGPEYVPEEGAFVYYTRDNYAGAVTFGNVVSGGKDLLSSTLMVNGQKDPQGRKVLDHEFAHMPQGTALGPGYLPAHLSSLGIGAILGGDHRYNVFERWWIDAPSY